MAKAIMLGAVSSGCGKTTITLGLIAALRARGLKVQAFKVGPDYIDTSYHAIASGRPSHNLDNWLVPSVKLRALFESSIGDADIAIVEGVMGLYDGGRLGISSTAEIAKLLDVPIALVIDAKSIGASAAAIALGFRAFDCDVEIAGVILNRLGSSTHQSMIEDALSSIGMKCFGGLRRDQTLAIPERHLGLLQSIENETSELIDRLRAAVETQLDLDALLDVAAPIYPKSGEIKKPRHSCKIGIARDEAFSFYYPASLAELEMRGAELIEFSPLHDERLPQVDGLIPGEIKKPRHSCKIGIARDEAFSFYYPASLAELEMRGAELIEFSPLHDERLPQVDGLILGGGYPEMFASQLESNATMREDIRRAAADGMPICAECGGYMYLMRELIDFDGRAHEMCGVISSRAAMNDRLQMVGYVAAELLGDCSIGRRGERVHAHEFHFSSVIEDDPTVERLFRCTRLRTGAKYDAGIVKGNVVGSYLHLHFAGCPSVAKRFISVIQRLRP